MSPEGAAELFHANGFAVDDAAIGRLLAYERLLLGWNEKINLVSRKETAEVFTRQIVASIAFLFSYRLAGGTTLLDVGTGGGLPGIPLAILRSDVAVTMIDSIRKKVRAVEEMIASLGLDGTRAICGRVEELDPRVTGRFDYIVARGVSSAKEIVEWSTRLLRVHPGLRAEAARDHAGSPVVPPGSFILLKGGDLGDELLGLSRVSGNAAVTVRPLSFAGAGDWFTDKKVIILTP